MSATVEAIKKILAKIKSDETLHLRLADTANLVDEVGLDSLEMLQLMLEIESSLAVQIDFDKLDFSYLRSIATLASFLDEMPVRPAQNPGS
jgi:acyl carrier protein